MARSSRKVCSNLCRIVIVISNIIGVLAALLCVLLGTALIWGFRLATAILKDDIREWTGSIVSSLQSSLGIEIDFVQLLNDIGAVTNTAGLAILLAGAVLLLLSCLGCCGACCKVTPCVVAYLIMLAVLFLGQVSLVSIWFSNAELLKSSARGAMQSSMNEFLGINGTNIQSLLQNVVQIFVGCCGVDNGTDFYSMSPKWNREFSYDGGGLPVTITLTYPVSCCVFNMSSLTINDTSCIIGPINSDNSNYKKGCYVGIFNFIEYYFRINVLFYTIGGSLAFQSLLIIGSIIILVNEATNKSRVSPDSPREKKYKD